MSDNLPPFDDECIAEAVSAMLSSQSWSSFWSDEDAKKLVNAALSGAWRSLDDRGLIGNWPEVFSAPHAIVRFPPTPRPSQEK